MANRHTNLTFRHAGARVLADTRMLSWRDCWEGLVAMLVFSSLVRCCRAASRWRPWGGGGGSRLSQYAGWYSHVYTLVRLFRSDSSTPGWAGWLSAHGAGGEGGGFKNCETRGACCRCKGDDAPFWHCPTRWHHDFGSWRWGGGGGRGGVWHVAMVYCSRLQLVAPTSRSPFAALPLDPFPP